MHESLSIYPEEREMVKVLVQHAAYVFQQFPTDTATKVQPNQKQQFLNMLPAEFDRHTYLAVDQKLNIQPKTAEKQIAVSPKQA